MKNEEPKKLHESARKKISAILKNILINFKNGESSFTLNQIEFKNLSTEVLKNYSNILDSSDVSGIFYENVSKFFPNKDISPIGEILTEISDDDWSNFSKSILSELDRLPIVYDIYLPLHKIKLNETTEISDGISLFVGPAIHGATVGLANPKTTFLKIRASGYVGGHKNQSAMHDALSKMKKIIEIGRLKNVFFISPFEGGLLSFLGQNSVGIISARAIDSQNPDKITNIPLDVNVSAYLAKIRLQTEFQNKNLFEKEKIPQGETIKKISKVFSVLDSEDASDNCSGLRRALEWSFDGEADEDEKISFIKKCISLEAVLGEGNETDSITERLSDRCAFLISNTPSERNTTRNSIKEIYKLRSKYVHGVIDRFTEKNRELANTCHKYLDKVLNKELDELERWHKNKSKKDN